MTLRSRLFATVALPVLSAAVIVEPVAARAVSQAQEAVAPSASEAQGVLVAQVTCSDGSEAADESGCAAVDAQRAAEQQAAEEAQRAAEQQAAEEAQRAAEQQAAEEAQRAAEQQAAEEEAQRAAEQQAAEEAQRAAEQQAAEEAQRAAEQQAAEEAQRAAEQQAAEEAQRAAEQQAAEEAQRAAEQQAVEQAQQQDAVTCADGSQAASADACPQAPAEEQQAPAEEQPAPAEEQPAPVEEQPAPAEEQPAPAEEPQAPAEEQQAPAEEQPAPAEEQPAPAEEQPAPAEEPQAPAEEQLAPAEEQPAPAEEQPAPAEEPQAPAEEQLAPAEEQPAPAEEQSAPAEEQQAPAEEQPAPTQDATEGEAPAAPDQSTADQAPEQEGEQVVIPAVEPPEEAPVPEIVDTRTEEEKRQIAEDPSKTSETVVLPVDNGAAVLDSDKDADNTGGEGVREQRMQLRSEEPVAALPESDAAAQVGTLQLEQGALDAAIEEEGTRLEAAPSFQVPPTIVNNVTNITNVTNNTVVQNNISNQVTEVKVLEQIDDRTIINIGNQMVVRGDERERIRYDAEESYYEELPRGRVRETIVRPNGSRIVTIYSRYGDIIQRSRITSDGDEYVLFYAPEADMDRPRVYVDVGYSLPPMRLTVPLDDYIVTMSDAPERDYYDFLAQPPVERVERVYSIEEVKSSARLRDKVRRIDLDTITFPSGSAEVPLAQAKTLRKVAEAMEKVLAKDPGEVFLIEGHTDAVGSDRSNLVLSDRRAETVANLLTEVYGIPPENMSVQGYGERYLKIRTQADEQQNRRVTIRRVTPLVRPVAANR